MNEQYISVKDFAGRAGITTQSVYQRITKDLVEYCQTIDGKKVISIEALKLFDTKEADNNLATIVQAFNAQLLVKDRLIEDLRAELAVANAHIREKSDALSALMDKQQQLLENQQKLNAMNLLPAATEQPEPRRHWWQRKK